MTERIVYNLQPLLHVRDLDETVSFWRDILGFRVDGLFPKDEPRWCGMHSGNARIMFALREDAGAPALTGQIYLYPDDIDATWEKLRGIVPVVEPLRLMEYGMREFSIRDPNGFEITLAASADHHEHDHEHEPHDHEG